MLVGYLADSAMLLFMRRYYSMESNKMLHVPPSGAPGEGESVLRQLLCSASAAVVGVCGSGAAMLPMAVTRPWCNWQQLASRRALAALCVPFTI